MHCTESPVLCMRTDCGGSLSTLSLKAFCFLCFLEENFNQSPYIRISPEQPFHPFAAFDLRGTAVGYGDGFVQQKISSRPWTSCMISCLNQPTVDHSSGYQGTFVCEVQQLLPGSEDTCGLARPFLEMTVMHLCCLSRPT